MRHTFTSAALALALLGSSTTARADEFGWPEHTRVWTVQTISGCKLILNSGSFQLNAAGTGDAGWDFPGSNVATRFTFEGPCGANGYADGRGTLRIFNFLADFTDYYVQYTGTFRNGLLTGPVVLETYNNSRDGQGYTGGANDEQPVFNDGCRVEFTPDALTPEDLAYDFIVASTCRPEDGRALQPRVAGSVVPAQASGGGGVGAMLGAFAAQLSPARSSLSDALDNAPRGNGQATVETILGALQASLGSGELAGLLGNDAGAIAAIMAQVRTALNGDGMSLLNGSKREILDTVVGLVDSAISQRQAAAMPASGPVASASSATSAPSSGGGYSLSPQNLFAAFQRINHPMLLGDPTTTGGQSFNHPANQLQIYTSYCDSPEGCAALEIRACYAFEHASLAKVNQWNREHLIGRTYIATSGQLCIDFNHYEPDRLLDDVQLAGLMQLFFTMRSGAPAYFNTP